ncbi:hypothetical protein ITJ38_17025 [Agreia pratensis]|uniref:Uncharacterized protein n=1 Tax=Agreia pratensis TaxID=150121 RepID=A0A1X7IZT5_9MICO|nr:darcynin family protein [Agreia pratensis]MBF4636115.1 hypothetical protein [Agreia pratensis]SMG20684.1 Darcynin, protein of unknown function [Agreia pratensis]
MPHSSLKYVVIVSLIALPSWLRLSRTERADVISAEVEPAAAAHHDCHIRWIDAESMTALCSDVMIIDTTDLRSWNHLWEQLRDSSLFAEPYFELVSIVPGIEDGYADYEAELAASDA